MSDVACVCCAPVIGEVRARGLQPERLVEGLGLDLRTLENARARIPWDSFRVFARRSVQLLGGPEEIEELAVRSAEDSVPGFLRRMLPVLGSPRPLYVIGARWWGPWVFRGTTATCEELPDGRLREVIEIQPEYGECPELFQGIRGILRAMPRLFAQPEAVVELQTDGRRGEFLIAPPPAKRRGFAAVFRRRTSASPPASPELEDLEELGFRQEQLRDSLRQTRAATALLADKSRRLDALNRLGRELGQPHEIADVVKVLIGLLEQRLPMRGLRLSEGPGFDGEGYSQLAESGDVAGPPSSVHALEVAGRTVGRLELWRSEDALAFGDEDTPLDDLLPWIAVALENARSNERAARIARWIEEGLPVERDEEAPGLPAETDAAETETLLLVHEDPLVRGVSRRALEAEGHRVIEAEDGEDALAICQASPRPIHLLVTDLQATLDPSLARRVMRLRPELRGVLVLRPDQP